MQHPRELALRIWQTAVDAVRADRLVRENISVANQELQVCGQVIPLDSFDRLLVVGAGKATAAMARGLLESLPYDFIEAKRIQGWVNVPGNCVEELPPLTVHSARHSTLNEPTTEGVFGSERILKMLHSAGPRDVCVCLISGGGSALLPAPVAGISLSNKIALTKFLSENGANIRELNVVRKQLSRTKGNRLASSFRGAQMISLIISDVIGDPLDIIASGPTVPSSTTAADALQVLKKFDPQGNQVARSIYHVLQDQLNKPNSKVVSAAINNHIIGNLETAVHAATKQARLEGFTVESEVAKSLEGVAETVGQNIAENLIKHKQDQTPFCLVSGGEPTVKLVEASHRKGGRNQQLVLAALVRMLQAGIEKIEFPPFCILSGGTDGEDGPTEAAGVFIDEQIISRMRELALDPADYLANNDAFNFFEQCGGLIKTGPTHTNVCDVRIALTCP